jgi:hypothetical protein
VGSNHATPGLSGSPVPECHGSSTRWLAILRFLFGWLRELQRIHLDWAYMLKNPHAWMLEDPHRPTFFKILEVCVSCIQRINLLNALEFDLNPLRFIFHNPLLGPLCDSCIGQQLTTSRWFGSQEACRPSQFAIKERGKCSKTTGFGGTQVSTHWKLPTIDLSNNSVVNYVKIQSFW